MYRDLGTPCTVTSVHVIWPAAGSRHLVDTLYMLVQGILVWNQGLLLESSLETTPWQTDVGLFISIT
jgi:hypothetical protein